MRYFTEYLHYVYAAVGICNILRDFYIFPFENFIDTLSHYNL